MEKTASREELLTTIVRTISESFEIDASRIQVESLLYEDLDLDSIDAIDMAVKMQEITGRRVDERALRGLRTVGDVLNLSERLLREA